MPRVNLPPRHAAFIKLLEQRPEPVRMLVINGDGLFEPAAVSICLVVHESSHLALAFRASFANKGGCLAALADHLMGGRRTSRSSILFPRQQCWPIALGFFHL